MCLEGSKSFDRQSFIRFNMHRVHAQKIFSVLNLVYHSKNVES